MLSATHENARRAAEARGVLLTREVRHRHHERVQKLKCAGIDKFKSSREIRVVPKGAFCARFCPPAARPPPPSTCRPARADAEYAYVLDKLSVLGASGRRVLDKMSVLVWTVHSDSTPLESPLEGSLSKRHGTSEIVLGKQVCENVLKRFFTADVLSRPKWYVMTLRFIGELYEPSDNSVKLAVVASTAKAYRPEHGPERPDGSDVEEEGSEEEGSEDMEEAQQAEGSEAADMEAEGSETEGSEAEGSEQHDEQAGSEQHDEQAGSEQQASSEHEEDEQAGSEQQAGSEHDEQAGSEQQAGSEHDEQAGSEQHEEQDEEQDEEQHEEQHEEQDEEQHEEEQQGDSRKRKRPSAAVVASLGSPLVRRLQAAGGTQGMAVDLLALGAQPHMVEDTQMEPTQPQAEPSD